jgi:hypothetical protein
MKTIPQSEADAFVDEMMYYCGDSREGPHGYFEEDCLEPMTRVEARRAMELLLAVAPGPDVAAWGGGDTDDREAADLLVLLLRGVTTPEALKAMAQEDGWPSPPFLARVLIAYAAAQN